MTEKQIKSTNESKLVEKIKESLSKDIKINKNLNGIDFSNFLGTVLNLCTVKCLYARESEEDNTFFSTKLNMGLYDVADILSKEYGKKVDFIESAQTTGMVMDIYDEDKLNELYNYSVKIQTSKDIKANNRAVKRLTHFLNYGE